VADSIQQLQLTHIDIFCECVGWCRVSLSVDDQSALILSIPLLAPLALSTALTAPHNNFAEHQHKGLFWSPGFWNRCA
jgi:hypothetical protein